MNKHRIAGWIGAWVLAVSVAEAGTLQGTGAVEFSVKATGHAVEGTVDLAPFEVEVTDGESGPVMTWTCQAHIEDMKTGNDKRDKEMWHALKADEQPDIVGVATKIPMSSLEGDEHGVASMPFRFSLAGVELDYKAGVTHYRRENDTTTFTASFIVSQLAHGLTPIRKMGFLKVRDPVHVQVHFALAKP